MAVGRPDAYGPKPDSRLAVVIVSFNVRELLRRCLRSVAASADASGLDCTIVVVDSASSDGTVAMLDAEFPQLDVLASEVNLGFAGGNNAALRAILGAKVVGRRSKGADTLTFDLRPSTFAEPRPYRQGLPPPYILLLNPDTEVVDDALARMVEYLDRHPEVAVVGPRLRYGDGTLQSSRRRFPTPGTLFWESTLLEQWWPRNPWTQRYRFADRPVDHATRVDWLVGAALMVRREAIERVGLLDQGFWMYSEELEWQARLGRYGAVVYLPAAEIVHFEGKSSEQNMARRHIAFNRSKLRYARLRWGRRVADPLLLFLLLGYVVQVALEGGKWLLGHKRELRRWRIAEHVRVATALMRGEPRSRHEHTHDMEPPSGLRIGT